MQHTGPDRHPDPSASTRATSARASAPAVREGRAVPGASGPTDGELVAAATAGDRRASDDLYRRHEGIVRRALLAKLPLHARTRQLGLHPEETLEHGVDGGFMRALTSYDAGRGTAFRTWWITCSLWELHDVIREAVRRTTPLVPLLGEESGNGAPVATESHDRRRGHGVNAGDDPETMAVAAAHRWERRRQLRALLAQLPEEDHFVLVFIHHHLGDSPTKVRDAAARLGLTLAETKAWLRRATRRAEQVRRGRATRWAVAPARQTAAMRRIQRADPPLSRPAGAPLWA
jgi:hypothetical protein